MGESEAVVAIVPVADAAPLKLSVPAGDGDTEPLADKLVEIEELGDSLAEDDISGLPLYDTVIVANTDASPLCVAETHALDPPVAVADIAELALRVRNGEAVNGPVIDALAHRVAEPVVHCDGETDAVTLDDTPPLALCELCSDGDAPLLAVADDPTDELEDALTVDDSLELPLSDIAPEADAATLLLSDVVTEALNPPVTDADAAELGLRAGDGEDMRDTVSDALAHRVAEPVAHCDGETDALALDDKRGELVAVAAVVLVGDQTPLALGVVCRDSDAPPEAVELGIAEEVEETQVEGDCEGLVLSETVTVTDKAALLLGETTTDALVPPVAEGDIKKLELDAGETDAPRLADTAGEPVVVATTVAVADAMLLTLDELCSD